MTIGYRAKCWLGYSCIKTRRTVDIDILALVVDRTDNVMVPASILDQVGEKGLGVQGIGGDPGGRAGGWG